MPPFAALYLRAARNVWFWYLVPIWVWTAFLMAGLGGEGGWGGERENVAVERLGEGQTGEALAGGKQKFFRMARKYLHRCKAGVGLKGGDSSLDGLEVRHI